MTPQNLSFVAYTEFWLFFASEYFVSSLKTAMVSGANLFVCKCFVQQQQHDIQYGLADLTEQT
jgi:hypothetical protein